MSEGYYDVEELRKLIKNVKMQCVALENEQRSLETENSKFEEQFSSLQKEYNILNAIVEADTLDGEENEANQDENNLGPIDHKKLAEADRKLELQILNQEIRAVLPKLEAEALKAELSMHSLEKHADSLTQGRPNSNKAVATSMFQKSLEELEEDMGATVEARVKLRARMALEADAKRKQKQSLIARISAARNELYSLLDNRESLREASKNTNLSLESENARIAYLVDKHAQVRRLINPFHETVSEGGQGWHVEAFTSHTAGVRDALIDCADIPSILKKWLPSPDLDLSEESVLSTLRDMGASTDRVGLHLFSLLATRLGSQSNQQ